jgi:pectinesterase
MHRLALFLALVTLSTQAQDVTVLVRPGAPLNGATPAASGLIEYPTIQNALDHAPEPGPTGRVTIRITPGTYNERLWIPQNRPRITLLGLGTRPEDTVITSAHFAKDSGGTFFTETVEVNGESFAADNLTFANSAGNVGQAVAVSVLADRAIFKHCRFLGYQDTLFANYGRQYYLDSYIEGAVDYVFGNATAVFDHTEFHTTAPGYITAQSRLNPRGTTGFLILNSHLTFTPQAIAGKGVALGRPWRPHSRVIFLNTNIDAGLNPQGFVDWNKDTTMATAFYAEANSTGPGASPATRAAAMKHLTPASLRTFQTRTFLRGADNWNPEAEAAKLP